MVRDHNEGVPVIPNIFDENITIEITNDNNFNNNDNKKIIKSN